LPATLTWVFCENRLNNVHDVSYKLCVYKAFLREAIGGIPPLHDGQQELGVALTGCGMCKVIVDGEFSRQGKHQYLHQLQFFTEWILDLSFFSISELP
jgi:hypothetical protein